MKNNVFAAFAIFVLATHGVYAQSLTLHSGDHITVDGTGTHGVMNSRRVDNEITSYTSHGKVFGVDNDAVQVNGTATFTLGSGGSINGGSNGIALEALGNSRVTVTGGTITCDPPTDPQSFCYGTALSADNTSLVTVSGGTITGGQFGPALATEISGAILVSGGTITSGKYGPALVSEGSGTITLMGGRITANRKFESMIAGGANGTIDLFSRGEPFLVNGKALNKTSLAANASGTLSGTLADGQPIDITFLNGGHIRLNVGRPPTTQQNLSNPRLKPVGFSTTR